MSQYNEKLFSGGPRSYLHHMRFHWLRKHIHETANAYTLFELGCFDCRSLKFLPEPSRYVGADADWEGGLQSAKATFHDDKTMELLIARSAGDLAAYKDRSFDYSIALETIEHIPDAVLSGYIEFLARVTRKKLLITVPVEIGPVFLAKHFVKRSIAGFESGETETYTLAEIFWSALGRTEKVRRFEHKGFNYRTFITQLSSHFHIRAIEGIPFRPWPYLSFQVGIVAEPKVKP
ncbi:MAG: hypothetical protein ACOYJ2_06330 [Rickettsiales bacterium]